MLEAEKEVEEKAEEELEEEGAEKESRGRGKYTKQRKRKS